MARTGKYANVLDKLPKFVNQDITYQERVNLVKSTLVSHGPLTASDLAQMYADLRREKAILEDQEAILNLRLEGVSQLLSDAYEAESITSLKLSDGATIRVQPEPYAQIEDREAFRLWCLSQGLERSLVLPWTTANALTKERLLNGEPEPDGVRAFVKNKLVFQP